jgi:uncharacterized protein (DUF427 family)
MHGDGLRPLGVDAAHQLAEARLGVLKPPATCDSCLSGLVWRCLAGFCHSSRDDKNIGYIYMRAARLAVPERLTLHPFGPTKGRAMLRKIKAMSDRAEPKTKTVKTPGPDHPITIESNSRRVVVTLAGRVVADTREALTLREANYPPVQYIPRKDVEMALLARTHHATYCPYKGDCAYYSIPIGGARSLNAVWTYEAPYSAVAAIKDHIAFYPDRVDAIEERSEE